MYGLRVLADLSDGLCPLHKQGSKLAGTRHSRDICRDLCRPSRLLDSKADPARMFGCIPMDPVVPSERKCDWGIIHHEIIYFEFFVWGVHSQTVAMDP